MRGHPQSPPRNRRGNGTHHRPTEPRPIKVIKHFYDNGVLADIATDAGEAIATYRKIHAEQIKFRGTSHTLEDALHDSQMAAYHVCRVGGKNRMPPIRKPLSSGKFSQKELPPWAVTFLPTLSRERNPRSPLARTASASSRWMCATRNPWRRRWRRLPIRRADRCSLELAMKDRRLDLLPPIFPASTNTSAMPPNELYCCASKFVEMRSFP